MILESGRSLGEGVGYPLQHSWASLVAQTVKNLPMMQETWVCSLGWEDPQEEGTATHSSILAWRIPWTEEPGGLQSMGLQRVRQDWETKHKQDGTEKAPSRATRQSHMEDGLALTRKGILDYKFVYILSQFQVKELGFHSAIPVSYWWRDILWTHKPPGHPALSVWLHSWLADCGKSSPKSRRQDPKKSEHTEACRGEYRNGQRVWGPGWNFQCLSHICLSYSFGYSWKPYNFWWSPLLPIFRLPKCHSHSYLATMTSLWFATGSWSIIENMSLFFDFFKIPVT